MKQTSCTHVWPWPTEAIKDFMLLCPSLSQTAVFLWEVFIFNVIATVPWFLSYVPNRYIYRRKWYLSSCHMFWSLQWLSCCLIWCLITHPTSTTIPSHPEEDPDFVRLKGYTIWGPSLRKGIQNHFTFDHFIKRIGGLQELLGLMIC